MRASNGAVAGSARTNPSWKGNGESRQFGLDAPALSRGTLPHPRRCRSVRFGSVRFGSVRFGSVRLRSIRLRSIRFRSVRLRSVRLRSVRFGSVRLHSARFGSVRFGLVRFGSVRFGLARFRLSARFSRLGSVRGSCIDTIRGPCVSDSCLWKTTNTAVRRLASVSEPFESFQGRRMKHLRWQGTAQTQSTSHQATSERE